MSIPLEEYALLSDLHTAALVSRQGSIDWLCLPRFDSAAMFTALLGTADDGRWRLSAVDGEVTGRRYVDRTFVLETDWRTPTGTVRVTDFMPPGDRHADLIRRVECLEGHVEIEHDLRIRFDYARSTPWFRRVEPDSGSPELLCLAGPDGVRLAGRLLELDDGGADNRSPDAEGTLSHRLSGRFPLVAGERLDWDLTWFPSWEERPPAAAPDAALARAVNFWQSWSDHVEVDSPHDDLVLRSLLVLRALTHQGTGGIVAAPTTSLPEEFGGVRNWDYRYTWLRDASLTIETLVSHGFTKGALHWRDWLLRAVAGDVKDMKIMYGLSGERQLPESTLDHLAGYEGSSPVRIGNEAADQYQADVVGEVMLALGALRDAGEREDAYSWGLQKSMLQFCIDNYDRKDHGIWEMRGTPHYFTHGRVMMWAAFDQGIKATERHGLDGDVDTWRAYRDRLRSEILERGFNQELNSFTQTYGNTEVDASLLQLPHTGFLDAGDPRMLGTVARIEQDLMGPSGLLHRYRTAAGFDGIEGSEYPFLICVFWLVEQYADSGRLDEATALMVQLTGYANDLGLLAEEYDPDSGRLAGNFPQAFSHLGLIRAADAIEEARGGKTRR